METKSLVASLKSSTQFVVAIAGLVTAVTSLVKACDKRLEQASYEALAASIESMQKDQLAIHAELKALHTVDIDHDGIQGNEEIIRDDDGLKADLGLKFPVSYSGPSASAFTPVIPVASHKPPSFVRKRPPPPVPTVMAVDAGVADVGASDADVMDSSAPPMSSGSSGMSAPPAPPAFKPPPSWNDVKQQADKL